MTVWDAIGCGAAIAGVLAVIFWRIREEVMRG